MPDTTVLFVCVQNAGRSQMAAAFMQRHAGYSARSAGSAPADAVHPEVVEAMAEVGIDLRERHPTSVENVRLDDVDVVVTMGCGDACPTIPGAAVIHWDIPDPSGQDIGIVRSVRDTIASRVAKLAEELA